MDYVPLAPATVFQRLMKTLGEKADGGDHVAWDQVT